MRNALLLTIAGLATVTLFACGDASSSTNQRSHGGTAIPEEGSDQGHDPNAPSNEPADPVNPNASAKPPAPTTTGTPATSFAVELSSATPTADLGTSTDITVTITPKAGATGNAVLSVTGLPAGATAVFAPPSVALGSAPVTSKMTITTLLTAAPSAAAAVDALVITATAGTVTATANANFKMNPKINMTIPLNADALRAAVGTRYVDGWGGAAIGSAPAALQTQTGNPITVVVKNLDSVAHIVHGNAGFIHGDTANPVAPGAVDPKNRTLAAGVTTSGYLHDGANGTSESFRISVNAAP